MPGVKIDNDKAIPFVHIVPKKAEPTQKAVAQPPKVAASAPVKAV